MINFATTDKLRVITGTAVPIDTLVSWVNDNGGTITPGNQVQNIVLATTTDIMDAPAAGVTTIVSAQICNTSSSLSCDVTVNFSRSGTAARQFKVTLLPGDVLQYEEGLGWWVTSAGTGQFRVVCLPSDHSTSSTTPDEVTGLSLVTGLGTFMFIYHLIHQAAATTTGIKLSANHAGTVSQFLAWQEASTALSTAADGIQDQDITTTTGGLLYVSAQRAKSTAGLGANPSVDVANADLMTVVRGICTVTADGELELWHGSEAAAATTVKAGSSLLLIRTGP